MVNVFTSEGSDRFRRGFCENARENDKGMADFVESNCSKMADGCVGDLLDFFLFVRFFVVFIRLECELDRVFI